MTTLPGARIVELERALRQVDAWIEEWSHRDERKRFFAQPNEVNYCRAFIATARRPRGEVLDGCTIDQ